MEMPVENTGTDGASPRAQAGMAGSTAAARDSAAEIHEEKRRKGFRWLTVTTMLLCLLCATATSASCGENIGLHGDFLVQSQGK